jgi:hypothetical protein
VRVKKLLPVSAGAGYPAPRIGRDGWRRLEQAIGRPIAPKVRRKIRSATREYLANAALERGAPPISPELERVRKLRAAAAAIYAIYGNRVADGRRTAYHHIRADKLRALAVDSRDMMQDCDAELRALGTAETEDHGYRVGEEWARWIWRLKKVLEAARLPVGVRKDTDKHPDPPSPFVAFTREVQRCLPAEFRQHTHSDAGLAVAIVRALKDVSGRIKSVAANYKTRPKQK